MRRVNAWEMTQEEQEALWAANDRAWAEAESKKTATQRYDEWWEDMHDVDYSAACSVLCD